MGIAFKHEHSIGVETWQKIALIVLAAWLWIFEYSPHEQILVVLLLWEVPLGIDLKIVRVTLD